jgi:DNA-binding MarR family transcriptional regulator
MQEQSESGYWYPTGDRVWNGVDVLGALRRYRTAEVAMRRRTRASMRMGETDLAALRFLLAAQERSRPVSPKDLAQYLSISSASTTTLIDRLVKSGHVERLRHPSDGRAVVLNITAMSDNEVRSMMSEMHKRMIEVTSGLSGEEAAIITAFLSKMAQAIDQVDEHALEQAAPTSIDSESSRHT